MLQSVAKLQEMTTEFFKLMEDGSKTAHGQARKVSNAITKMLPVYRKECVEYDKQNTKKRETQAE